MPYAMSIDVTTTIKYRFSLDYYIKYTRIPKPFSQLLLLMCVCLHFINLVAFLYVFKAL